MCSIFKWNGNCPPGLLTILLKSIGNTNTNQRQTDIVLIAVNDTVSQKTIQLWNDIARNCMDRFWWYLAIFKDSRIEFACFSFHVGLLVITLSSLKLHTENNACMLCASVSCWVRLFLQHFWRRSLWIIHETDDQWIPLPHVKFLWLFGGSEVCLRDSATATQLPTVLNFTSRLLMLFFVQPLFRNVVLNCQALQPLHSYRFLIKIFVSITEQRQICRVCLAQGQNSRYFRCPVWKIKRQNVDKKQTYMKTETCKLYCRDVWIFLPNIVKIDTYIFELYRFFMLGRFLRHSVYVPKMDVCLMLVLTWAISAATDTPIILQFCFKKVLTIGISRNGLPIFIIVLPIPIPILIF